MDQDEHLTSTKKIKQSKSQEANEREGIGTGLCTKGQDEEEEVDRSRMGVMRWDGDATKVMRSGSLRLRGIAVGKQMTKNFLKHTKSHTLAIVDERLASADYLWKETDDPVLQSCGLLFSNMVDGEYLARRLMQKSWKAAK